MRFNYYFMFTFFYFFFSLFSVNFWCFWNRRHCLWHNSKIWTTELCGNIECAHFDSSNILLCIFEILALMKKCLSAIMTVRSLVRPSTQTKNESPILIQLDNGLMKWCCCWWNTQIKKPNENVNYNQKSFQMQTRIRNPIWMI